VDWRQELELLELLELEVEFVAALHALSSASSAPTAPLANITPPILTTSRRLICFFNASSLIFELYLFARSEREKPPTHLSRSG